MKQKAFTLAEILITLGIIGIIAALTTPTLIQNQQKKIALTRLKKTYTITSQIIQRAEFDSGTKLSNWSEWEQDSEAVLKTYFLPYAEGAKIYNSNNDWRKAMCFEAEKNLYKQYSWLTGVLISSPLYQVSSIKLKDGTCIGLSSGKFLFFDINGGMNKPNIAGKDLFMFTIDTDGKILPYGYNWQYQDLTNENKENACNKKARSGGMVCAAKIIIDGWEIQKDYPW